MSRRKPLTPFEVESQMLNRNGVPWIVCALLVGCSDAAVEPMMMSPVGQTAGTAAPPVAGTAAPMTAAGAGATGTAGTGAAGSTVTGQAGTGAAGQPATTAGTGAAAGSGGTGAATAGTAAAGMPATTAGSGGAAGMSMAAGSGGAAGTGEPMSTFKRPCVGDGNEVVFIGDSYSDYAIAHSPLAGLVADRAKEAGALMRTDSYRNLAVAGTTLAAPPAAIQGQWEDAKRMKPIKAIVMTGGGNDVLINNPQCRAEGSEKTADCMGVVQASLDAAKKMFADMQASGVSDVVYFWYPHIPGGALTGFEKAWSISDYTYPMLEAIAMAASTDTFHVYMVPTVEIFEGHPEYFFSDGLHANDVGEGKIADAVWAKMKENCIAQSSASGCCMP